MIFPLAFAKKEFHLSRQASPVPAALSVSNFSSTTSPSIFWKGFIKTNDPEISENIQRAGNHIFKILVPAGPFKIENINKGLSPSLSSSSSVTPGTSANSSNPSSGVGQSLKNDNTIWRQFQFDVCRTQKINNCPIFEMYGIGTAFLIDNSFTLATNLHSIYKWTYQVKGLNPEVKIDNLFLPILIQSGEAGNRMMLSPVNGNYCRLSFYNRSNKIWNFPYEILKDKAIFRSSDYVEMLCEKKLSNGFLKRSHRLSYPQLSFKAVMAEIYYLVAYPWKTEILKKNGGIDSDGDSQLVSMGRIIDFNLDKISITVSNPASMGSSGGPLLNRYGEAVGIVYSGLLERSSEKDRSATGVVGGASGAGAGGPGALGANVFFPQSEILPINKDLLRLKWLDLEVLQ